MADSRRLVYCVLAIFKRMQTVRIHSAKGDVQGRPVNVKHDARCVMGKVGGKTKNPKRGKFNLYEC